LKLILLLLVFIFLNGQDLEEVAINSYLAKQNINFTQEEKNYLKQKKLIKMCIDPNWMPFEKIENGKHIGISADIIKLFNEKLEIPIVLEITNDWIESVKKIKNRECDILPTATKTRSRLKYLNFTTPYMQPPNVIATKYGVPFVNNIELILDKKIGIVKEYSSIEELEIKYPTIKIVRVDSIYDGLEKVKDGTIFCLLDNSISLNYEIQKNYIESLTISGKFIYKDLLSIATRNDEKLLNQIFEKLQNSITRIEKQKIINKWVSIGYKEEIDHTLSWQILFISSIIFLIFIISNLRLRKEVNKRKQIEVILKDSESKSIVKTGELERTKNQLFELNSNLEEKIKSEILKNEKQQHIMMQQNKLAQMGEMIENIAHQWRQPLSQVNSSVLMIDAILQKNNFENEDVEEKLLEIESMTKYMSSTIDDFKNFFNKNKEKELFSFDDIIEKSLKIVQGSLKINNIKVDIMLDTKSKYLGYPSELQQVIVIILNNAKDVLVDRSIKNPQIRIKVTDDSKYYTIFIHDNAGGIEGKNIDKIFEPYFTTKHKTQGIGLGLYMSKMIIETGIGGKFIVKNKNDGACFKILLSKEDL